MNRKIQSDTDKANYRASCTHYRKGHVIHTVDGAVVFTGERTVKSKGKSSTIPCVNEAKRWIRSNSVKSYTIKAGEK